MPQVCRSGPGRGIYGLMPCADDLLRRHTSGCWSRQRFSNATGLNLCQHLVDTGGWSIQGSQKCDGVSCRDMARAVQCHLERYPHPGAFRHTTALSRLFKVRVKFRGNQNLESMAHMSMLTLSTFWEDLERGLRHEIAPARVLSFLAMNGSVTLDGRAARGD